MGGKGSPSILPTSFPLPEKGVIRKRSEGEERIMAWEGAGEKARLLAGKQGRLRKKRVGGERDWFLPLPPPLLFGGRGVRDGEELLPVCGDLKRRKLHLEG